MYLDSVVISSSRRKVLGTSRNEMVSSAGLASSETSLNTLMMRITNFVLKSVVTSRSRDFLDVIQQAFELEGKQTEVSATSAKRNQITDNLLKRSGDLVNVVTKALNANSPNEPVHVRLRNEADEADKLYRVSVRKLDRQRLGLEERIEEILKKLQRWELERLAAVKTGVWLIFLQLQISMLNPFAL